MNCGNACCSVAWSSSVEHELSTENTKSIFAQPSIVGFGESGIGWSKMTGGSVVLESSGVVEVADDVESLLVIDMPPVSASVAVPGGNVVAVSSPVVA
jgi:hypothetical protein